MIFNEMPMLPNAKKKGQAFYEINLLG